MTVSSQTNNETFTGNGITTVWDIPFRFFNNSEVFVYLIDPVAKTTTPLSLGTDYTLTGAGLPEQFGTAPGKITTTVPVANLNQLYIERVLVIEQLTDILNQGEFFPEVHEDAFDRLTMLIQQLSSDTKGAIRVAIGDPEPARLVSAAQRANLLMGFDSVGNPIAIAPTSGSADALALLLANTNIVTQGAAMIGRGAQVVKSIAELRTLPGTTASKHAFVTGYYAQGDGGGGPYWMDPSDTTTADNGGTVIVAADGSRWKLKHSGVLNVKQFGAKGDGVFDDSIPTQACIDYMISRNGGTILYPDGTFNYQSKRPAGLTPWAFEDPNTFIKDASNIKFIGTGRTILTNSIYPANRAEQMLFYRCSNIEITGFIFQGNNTGMPTAVNNCGIGMLSCKGMSIHHNTLQGFQGSYIASSWLFDSWIYQNKFDVSAGTGVDCAFWQDVRFFDNTLTGNGVGTNLLGTTGFQCAYDIPNVGNNETGVFFRTYSNHVTVARNRISGFFTGALMADMVDYDVFENDFHNNFVAGTNPCTGLVLTNTIAGAFRGGKIRDNTFTNNGSTTGGSGLAIGNGSATILEVELNGNQIYDNQATGLNITGPVVLRGSGNWFGNRLTAQQVVQVQGIVANAATGSKFIDNPGFNPVPAVGLALPAGTGLANAVSNNRPYPATVYQSGGTGIHIVSAAGVDTTLLPGNQNTVRVEPYGKIYFATANTAAWTWVFD